MHHAIDSTEIVVKKVTRKLSCTTHKKSSATLPLPPVGSCTYSFLPPFLRPSLASYPFISRSASTLSYLHISLTVPRRARHSITLHIFMKFKRSHVQPLNISQHGTTHTYIKKTKMEKSETLEAFTFFLSSVAAIYVRGAALSTESPQ